MAEDCSQLPVPPAEERKRSSKSTSPETVLKPREDLVQTNRRRRLRCAALTREHHGSDPVTAR